jgi:hypothetical protein
VAACNAKYISANERAVEPDSAPCLTAVCKASLWITSGAILLASGGSSGPVRAFRRGKKALSFCSVIVSLIDTSIYLTLRYQCTYIISTRGGAAGHEDCKVTLTGGEMAMAL